MALSEVIVFQTAVDAEAGAQRGGEHAAAGGGADEGEGLEVQLHTAGRRTGLDHDVDAEVLHRRVEVLLHHGRKAVDFVDEKHVVGLQRGEQSSQVAGLVEHRTGGGFNAHTQLVGDDVAEGGLAQTRRAVEQHMVQRLATVLGGTDEDLEVLHHLLLTGETVEPRGAQRAFYLFLLCGYIISCQIVVHGAKIALFFLTAKSFSKTTTTNLIFNTKHIFEKKAGKGPKSSIYKIVTISI